MVKNLFKILLPSFIVLMLVECESKQTKQLTGGEIIYEISYPCLEKNEESFLFLLPNKMIMTFSNDQFKNEFIFPTKSSSLGLINNSYRKNAMLLFGLGNNKKYTIIDSNNVDFLLNFSRKTRKKRCKPLKIKNVNWCTPFYMIDDVIMEYSVKQFGMEMHFKAMSIKNITLEANYLQLEKKYRFSKMKEYLKEIKAMLSIFDCNE